MQKIWALELLVVIAYVAYGQERQDATWEGGWVAMNESPQQTEKDETSKLVFSSTGTSMNRNNNNNTTINTIIAQIIDSRREGRNLQQYDHVYADGNVEQALQQGNEIEARNLIRDKLCFLGLMSCEDKQRQQHIIPFPSRPQPGRFINYNGGSRPPLSPIQSAQTLNTFGPPRKVSYSQTFSPNNYKPNYPPGAIIYNNRPTTVNTPPYIFKQPSVEKIHGTVSLPQNSFHNQQAAASSSNIVVGHIATVPNAPAGPQQHVHHHFHHVDGVTNKAPTPTGAQGSYSQKQQVISPSLANIGGIQVSSLSYRPGFGGISTLSDGYTQSGYGQVGSSFHSQNPSYYKKELQNIGGITVASNSFNGQQFGEHNIERQQSLQCFCVPYSQCPAADRIGRKEDLILPIDPRNLGKDIEALDDSVLTNSTKEPSKREAEPGMEESSLSIDAEGRAYYGNRRQETNCRVHEICCRRPLRPASQQRLGQCGTRNAAGITGRIKNPVYVDGDSEFGEYPWHVAILKKDPQESIYACGGTLIDGLHVITAAHCIKAQNGFDLRARLGEWDVNHDVEFFPYVEREIVAVHVHPEYYAGTLDNDLALLRLDRPVDFQHSPHISPACLPDKYADFTGLRCWTTGWGKDAFGDHGKYQNILKEVDVPILSHQQCEAQLRQTRLGYGYKLNPGFICAGGEEGKDACKGDGGGPLVCERNGIWNVVGVVSWGIGCGLPNVPGVYVRVAHYLDWIRQLTQNYK